jgi:hypothetical protein
MDAEEDPPLSAAKPNANIVVREYRGRPYYEAKFRLHGRQVKRRIGPAWLERDPDSGGWRRHRGRPADGVYDERAATVAAAKLVDDHLAEAADIQRVTQERRTRGVTFREVARDYLRWLEEVRGAKPSTLRDHAYVLGEPGIAHKSGSGVSAGHVMAAIGDRPAAKITTREIDELLATVSVTGTSPRTVNKYRSVLSAAFNHGCKPSTFALPANPAKAADKRREPAPGALVFYSSSQRERNPGHSRTCRTSSRSVARSGCSTATLFSSFASMSSGLIPAASRPRPDAVIMRASVLIAHSDNRVRMGLVIVFTSVPPMGSEAPGTALSASETPRPSR